MEDGKIIEKGLDFFDLINKLYIQKKFLLKILIIGIIAGIIVAFSIPKEYTTLIVLTPDSQSGAVTSSMGSLAALAGISLGNNNVDVLSSPDLYPEVIQSTPFIQGLFNVKVKDEKYNVNTTLYKYMTEYHKNPWWSSVMKIPSLLSGVFTTSEMGSSKENQNNRFISEEEMSVIKNLQERIILELDKKTGIMLIEVSMQSPTISAYLADTLTSYLQTYIINYRTEKARQDLIYTEKLYKESKSNYYKAQKDLAAFIDGNLNVVLATFRINQERLQNEVSLNYAIYNQMAQQLQMARVKIQDTTPVFIVIQPAVQPLYPSKPSKKIILAAFMFISFIGGVVWTVRKEIWEIIIK